MSELGAADTAALSVRPRGARALPSGRQYRISFGEQSATIVEVGAAVREYRVGMREVFQSFGEDEVSWAYHGSVLLPWPNRVAEGRYSFDGANLQLPITEPARRTALHGLAAWRPWTLLDHHADAVTLQLGLLPSPGYPFHLDAVVEYRLGADGLGVRLTSTNTGDTALPYAAGFHPYVSAGPNALLDQCTLRIDARRRFVTDERLIPVGDDPVDGGDYDFRQPRSLAGRQLDDGFCDVVPDDSGRSRAVVGCPDGRTVEVWADRTVDYWQVYSGDLLPEPLARRGIAVEPMTAAANAFVNGRGVRRLEPGESATTAWGARLT